MSASTSISIYLYLYLYLYSLNEGLLEALASGALTRTPGPRDTNELSRLELEAVRCSMGSGVPAPPHYTIDSVVHSI